MPLKAHISYRAHAECLEWCNSSGEGTRVFLDPACFALMACVPKQASKVREHNNCCCVVMGDCLRISGGLQSNGCLQEEGMNAEDAPPPSYPEEMGGDSMDIHLPSLAEDQG